MDDRRWWAVLAVFTAIKLLFASLWSVVDDEAYYWVWAQRPALGYYDQPPLIAWLVRATTVLGDGAIALRLGAVASGVAAVALFVWSGVPKGFAVAWWSAVPVLCGLTWFCTPDAPLLAFWSLAVAAALRGGAWWWLAGLGAGLAFLCKYTGAGVYPLLVLAVGPREWRTGAVWGGAAVALLVASPNLAWNVAHDWITFRFQLGEGLVSSAPPGVSGLVRQVADQALALGGLLAAAVVVWSVGTAPKVVRGWLGSEPTSRFDRIVWFTSVPLLVFFAWAGTREVADAHWPAIAYVGAGIGLSRATGALRRLVDVGLVVGAGFVAAAVVHSRVPLVTLEHDPAVRLGEGAAVAAGLATWVFREGAAHEISGAAGARTVYTERYQEAALIHYYLGVPAHRYPGCGRDDQYDLWLPPDPGSDAIYVRPGTTGRRALCTDGRFDRRGPAIVPVHDPSGRRARNRQVWELVPR